MMLCGAEDTDYVYDAFKDVVGEFGGEPMHYQNGSIVYVNSGVANWSDNSRMSVESAELCVFVVVERYGALTWTVELTEALHSGKPFIIMCLGKTYKRYKALSRSLTTLDAIADEKERTLVATLKTIESDRQLTIVPYEMSYFRDVLREAIAGLFSYSLGLLRTKNQRAATLGGVTADGKLSRNEYSILAGLAVDESEEKSLRKRAIVALATNGGADNDDVRTMLMSMEQGVQRLAVERLSDLYVERPADQEFLNFCVELANTIDDVGVRRRLIAVILRIDLSGGINALGALDMTEIGTRRRLAAELELHESEIKSRGLTRMVEVLLGRCLVAAKEDGWLDRCRDFLRRLEIGDGRPSGEAPA